MSGKIKCPNCGDLAVVAIHRDDDEYEWSEEEQRYKPIDDYPTPNDIVCPKCNANLDGEFDGFGVTSIEDEPEGGDANGEK